MTGLLVTFWMVYLISLMICIEDYSKAEQITTATMIIALVPILNTIHTINIIRKNPFKQLLDDIKKFI